MKNYTIFAAAIIAVFIINLFSDSIDPYFLTVIMFIGINIILATSLNLINGYTGQFSLGHAGFMAIGAYTSACLYCYFAPFFIDTFGEGAFGSSIIFILMLIAGGTAAAIVGLIVGIPSLRLKGDYLAIVTLGFSEIIRVIIQGVDWIGGAQGFRGVYVYENGTKSLNMVPELADMPNKFYAIQEFTNFFWVFTLAIIGIFVIGNMINSTYGRGFLAVKDDEIAAEAMGINTTKFKVTAFVTGAFFAGIAGTLFAFFNEYINPEDFNFLRSVEIVVMVILGGMGSMVGVIIAAIVLTILPELLREVAEYRMIIYSLLLIIMMLLRPQGLFGVRLRRQKKVGKEHDVENT
jgi:branched-chain amino acid transport system permease protein